MTIVTPLARVNEEIGKCAGGKSYKTVTKVETILKQAPQGLIDKARHGQISINLAHQMVKRSNDHKNTPELPKEQFDIILADPPWTYEFLQRGNPQDHYQTMPLDQIKSLQVPSNIGLGYYFRARHELLLLGKKGNDIPTPIEANRPDSVICAPRTRHSEKPEIVYDIIEKMYPNRKYLELFARKERPGWTAWGNEVVGAPQVKDWET